MKINPILIHNSTDKWVEGKPEPADKMGKEHDSLVRLRVGTTCPAGGRRWPIFLARYSASRSFLISFSWTVEAIQMPPAPDSDIFGKLLFDGKEEGLGVRARAEGNELAEAEGACKEEGTLSLYKGW